jgi:hypothetical protein
VQQPSRGRTRGAAIERDPRWRVYCLVAGYQRRFVRLYIGPRALISKRRAAKRGTASLPRHSPLGAPAKPKTSRLPPSVRHREAVKAVEKVVDLRQQTGRKGTPTFTEVARRMTSVLQDQPKLGEEEYQAALAEVVKRVQSNSQIGRKP